MNNHNEIIARIKDIDIQIKIHNTAIRETKADLAERYNQITRLKSERACLLEELTQNETSFSKNESDDINLDFSEKDKDASESDFKLDVDEQNNVTSAES